MSRLPVLSGKKLCNVLARLGYQIDHQTGSHIILRNTNAPYRRLTVPNHKEIAKGTLRSIIRNSGLTVEEFQLFAGKHVCTTKTSPSQLTRKSVTEKPASKAHAFRCQFSLTIWQPD